MRCMIHFTVGPLRKPTTLSSALKMAGISSTLRRRIKHNGTCRCNGIIVPPYHMVHTGDTICITLPIRNAFEPEYIPIRIAYEDDYLLIIDKAAGLLMHPTSAQRQGTLANAVAYYYNTTNQYRGYHPVHRLDKNTSGLCLIAKEPHIQSLFDKQKLLYRRVYWAIVTGYFPASLATINMPIAREPASIIKRHVDNDGKPAQSYMTRLAMNETYSLLQIFLATGRTHQIRVHCSALGYPLIGDDLYGGTQDKISRQALHACAMELIHPVTHKHLFITAPLPPDMQSLLIQARWEHLLRPLSQFT